MGWVASRRHVSKPSNWRVASIEKGSISLFAMVFGCWHQRCSFPITMRGKQRRSMTAASITGTFVDCHDCGREFPYDCLKMKMLATPHSGWAAGASTTVPGLKAA